MINQQSVMTSHKHTYIVRTRETFVLKRNNKYTIKNMYNLIL